MSATTTSITVGEFKDQELESLMAQEERRQAEVIRLIPSENYVSRNVLKFTGSVLMNKYSEGYPGARYYEGTEIVDRVENLAIERAKKLFGAEHANVQPYSGSPANMAVYFAFAKPGGTVLGMKLSDGGHLTHGTPVNYSGKFFNSISYSVNPETGRLEMESVRKIAQESRPSVIICGGSAYPRRIDFAAFREIADEVGARLMVDMAHFGGLVAAQVHPSPVPYADVVTMTTHKVLRGPRGGMILCRSQYASMIDQAVFPGLQGGPHNHTVAGIATALYEASTPAYRQYGKKVLENASFLAQFLIEEGFELVTGGTDTHLILIDLRKKKLPGKVLSRALANAGIITNANMVPGDKGSPKHPNGLRLGTPAVTTRGMGEEEMKFIARKIARVAAHPEDTGRLQIVKKEVLEMTTRFSTFPEF